MCRCKWALPAASDWNELGMQCAVAVQSVGTCRSCTTWIGVKRSVHAANSAGRLAPIFFLFRSPEKLGHENGHFNGAIPALNGTDY